MIGCACPGYLAVVAGFKDFNFKLLVVEQLIYTKSKRGSASGVTVLG